jgi:hypothetical protein
MISEYIKIAEIVVGTIALAIVAIGLGILVVSLPFAMVGWIFITFFDLTGLVTGIEVTYLNSFVFGFVAIVIYELVYLAFSPVRKLQKRNNDEG